MAMKGTSTRAPTREPARGRHTPATRPIPIHGASVFAVVVIAVSALGLVLDFASPWAFLTGDAPIQDRTLHREDFSVQDEETGAYLRSLTTWPLVAWMGGMAAAGLLLVSALIGAAWPPLRALRAPIGALLVVLGALVLIAKLRLLAFLWGPLWYGETVSSHPHLASYYQLAGALLFLVGGATLLRPGLRVWYGARPLHPFAGAAGSTAALTCLGVLATFALFSMLPYAGTETGYTSFGTPVTEHALAVAAEGQGTLAVAGNGLGTARTFLWATFAVSLLAAVAAALAPARNARNALRGVTHVQILVVIPLLLALGHGIVHFVSLWRAIETLPLFNWTPIIAPLALLALQYPYYRNGAMPAAAQTRRTVATAGARKVQRAEKEEEDVEEIVVGAPATAPRRGAKA